MMGVAAVIVERRQGLVAVRCGLCNKNSTNRPGYRYDTAAQDAKATTRCRI